MNEPAPENEFFLKFWKEYGLTDQSNSITTPMFEGVFGGRKRTEIEHTHRFFEAHPRGIQINYLDPRGHQYFWSRSGDKSKIPYNRIRLQRENVYEKEGKKETQKYSQAKGSPHLPFFTPGIILKFLDEESTIDTLYIVEGEKKAFKANMVGIDIIGIPSIHGFYGSNEDISGRYLHEDIQELIVAKKVKTVVYLTDADTLTLKYEKDKDLYRRPHSFYKAVKNFRDSIDNLLNDESIELKSAYFVHMRKEFAETEKGIDDLLIARPAKTKDIIEQLGKHDVAHRYFAGLNITSQRSDLYKYFGLSDVESFYNLYKEFIGAREFRWRNSRYEWNGERVAYVRHEDAEKFMRIGADWMKLIKTPNKFGILEEDIIPFKIGEIQRDYKRFPDFIDQLPRYDGLCAEPNWTGDYKRVHYDCFNIFTPLTHDVLPGQFPTTIKFIKHLFGGDGNLTWNEETQAYDESHALGDTFTVALDYLTLQYTKPKQMLPVPCLVSPENGTGKSTFLKWLQAIYENNAVILDNERFQMKFNAHYITKYIISIDEGFLEVDKKKEKERLKQLATADSQFLENKGINIKKFPYYGKLLIASNDADRLMKIEDGETRWFVIKVPQFTKEDPFMEKKLFEEIPHWLDFLRNRKVIHPNDSRLWFKPEYFITEQMRKIVEVTRNRLDAVVEDFLKDLFLTYKEPVLRLTAAHICEFVNDPKRSKYKIDEKDLKYYLQEKKKMKPAGVQKVKIPISFRRTTTDQVETDIDGKQPMLQYRVETARPYIFHYADWLSEEEMEEFSAPWNLHKLNSNNEDLPF